VVGKADEDWFMTKACPVMGHIYSINRLQEWCFERKTGPFDEGFVRALYSLRMTLSGRRIGTQSNEVDLMDSASTL